MLCLQHNLKEHEIRELTKSHFVGLNPRFQTVPKSSPRLHDRCIGVLLKEINFGKNVSSRFRCDNKSFRFQGFSLADFVDAILADNFFEGSNDVRWGWIFFSLLNRYFSTTFLHQILFLMILFFKHIFLSILAEFGRFCWCDFGRTDFWRVKRR